MTVSAREKVKFDDYVKQKQALFLKQQEYILQKYDNMMKHAFEEKPDNMNCLFTENTTTAIEQIHTSSKNQQEIITDSCTTLCIDFKNDLELKSTQVTNDITTKAHNTGTASITRSQEEWKLLEDNMKKSYTQLTKMNSIAIKNNKILTEKLKDTESKLTAMDETIALQKASIDNMTSIINSNDNILSQQGDAKSSEYKNLVDTTAKKIISTSIKKEYKDILSKEEISSVLEQRCKLMGDETSEKINVIVSDAITIFEDKIKDTMHHECEQVCASMAEGF